MTTIIQVVFLVSAIALAVLVLLQQSKSGMGASFGGGASSTVFGARGAGDFLYKTTRLLAVVFFISALLLGYAQNKDANRSNILERISASEVQQKSGSTVDIPSASGENAPSSTVVSDIPSASQKASE